jgi:hypothetical protein
MYRPRTQIDNKTLWLENPMSFLEGMDHALLRDASEGP